MAKKSVRKACYAKNATAIRWIEETVLCSQFEAKATEDYVDLDVKIPAGSFVFGTTCDVIEAFDAPDASAAAVTVGVDGDEDQFSASGFDVKGSEGSLLGDPCASPGIWYRIADTTPRVTLTLTGDNCEDLTAGKATIRIFYIPAE